jgi:hypothetical protein
MPQFVYISLNQIKYIKNRGTKLSNMSILRLKAYWSSCATWGSKTCREVAHGPVCLLKAVSIRRDKKNQDNNPEEITEIICSSSVLLSAALSQICSSTADAGSSCSLVCCPAQEAPCSTRVPNFSHHHRVATVLVAAASLGREDSPTACGRKIA